MNQANVFNQRSNVENQSRQIPFPVDSYAGNPGTGPNYAYEDHNHELLFPSFLSGFPPNPTRGQTFLNTADMKLYVYYGATTGWQLPWNIPRGLWVESPAFSASTVGTTSLIQGTTASVQMYVNRIYRFVLLLDSSWLIVGATGETWLIELQQDSITIKSTNVFPPVANQYIPPGSISIEFFTTTNTHVYRVAATRQTTGAGSSLTFKGQLFIYDDGPSGTAPTS